MKISKKVKCPMCGRKHIIQTRKDAENQSDRSDIWNFGRKALDNARFAGQTAGTAAQVANGGALLLSLATQGKGAANLIPNGWVCGAAAASAVLGTLAKTAWDSWGQFRIGKESEEDQELAKRSEWNLCEECWKVVRFGEWK